MRSLAALLILALLSPLALSQQAITRAKTRAVIPAVKAENPWSSMVRYNALTDFADNRTPRSYIHSVMGTVGYSFNKNWGLELGAGARAETIDGQISKGREQSYDETLGPSTSLSLEYQNSFWRGDKFSVYLDGEPLWDEASRREGFKGIVGVGTNMTLRFFDKRYILTNDLSVAELINTFYYGSNLSPNPDYFYTYKLSNVVKIYRGFRASYSFGAKVTRYMDGFHGYSYSNTASLSYVWPQLSLSLAYDNGGFTDQGDISLWYLDQYRRLARVVVGYTF